MVLVAGEDRDIHRLDDWPMRFAGAINPIGERLKHSGPLVVFLPGKPLLDKPISKRLRFIGRGSGRNSQRQQAKKNGDVFDDIPPHLKLAKKSNITSVNPYSGYGRSKMIK